MTTLCQGYDQTTYHSRLGQGYLAREAFRLAHRQPPRRERTRRNPELGRLIAEHVAAEDVGAMCEALADADRAHARHIYTALCDRFDLSRCENCSRIEPTSDMVRDCCQSCADEQSRCERCRRWTFDNMTWIDGDSCCEACSEDAHYWEADGEYHWEPEPEDELGGEYGSSFGECCRIGTAIPTLPDCGFELEFGSQRMAETVEELREHSLVAGVERDGSLGSIDGREIVTHYGDIATIASKVPSLSEILKRGRCKSHDTTCCGLHVSLSFPDMESLTTYQLAKFVVFWNRPENEEFLRVFARRWNEGYCQPKPDKGELPSIEDTSRLRELARNSDRYELVNLQGMPTRIEVRAFRGTIVPGTITACLELAVWSLAFCRTDATDLSAAAFLQWSAAASATDHAGNVVRPARMLSYLAEKSTKNWQAE